MVSSQPATRPISSSCAAVRYGHRAAGTACPDLRRAGTPTEPGRREAVTADRCYGQCAVDGRYGETDWRRMYGGCRRGPCNCADEKNVLESISINKKSERGYMNRFEPKIV